MGSDAVPGWAYKVLAKRDVSLKQAAWAFGCAKKGSEEERLLLERFWIVVRGQLGTAATEAQPPSSPSGALAGAEELTTQETNQQRAGTPRTPDRGET